MDTFSLYSDSPDRRSSLSPEKYTHIRNLGEGSFGKVHLVKDHQNRKFAMKIIKLVNEEEGLSTAVLRETSILVELNHHNIIQLLGYDYSWESKTKIFMLICRTRNLDAVRTYGHGFDQIFEMQSKLASELHQTHFPTDCDRCGSYAS